MGFILLVESCMPAAAQLALVAQEPKGLTGLTLLLPYPKIIIEISGKYFGPEYF